MRILYVTGCGLACLIVVLTYGLFVAMLLAACLFVLYVLIDNKLTLSQYSKQIDNIYVCSQHEYDQYVEQRARDIEALLVKSGNKTGVKVLRYFFQDAETPDETWEEFQERVAFSIKADREARHRWLNENRSKYLIHALKQKIKNG